MIRQYIYSPAEAGLDKWPPGELRLEGIEITTYPTQADIYVCPGNLRIFEASTGELNHAKLNALPYFHGNESRHVFFDVSDNFKKPIHLPIIFLRCDCRSWMLPHDPNTINFAWPVEDFSDCVELPVGGFKHDIAFHGWVTSHETRQLSTDACLATPSLNCDFATYTDFTGYIFHEPEGLRRRAEFRRSMKESRIALCPESISGVFPYRFFEAMSAGRVPLLIGSDFVWPFQAEIPYDEFSITVPRAHAADAGDVATAVVKSVSDEQFVEMGRKARHYWEKYLDSRRWPELMSYAVQAHLSKVLA